GPQGVPPDLPQRDDAQRVAEPGREGPGPRRGGGRACRLHPLQQARHHARLQTRGGLNIREAVATKSTKRPEKKSKEEGQGRSRTSSSDLFSCLFVLFVASPAATP